MLGSRTTLLLIIICLFLSAQVFIAAAPMPGDTMPRVCLPGDNSQVYEWKAGRVTVFSFCAFWCDTWKEQSSRLASAQKALTGLPVDFVTISVDGRWTEKGHGKIKGRFLFDNGGSLSKSKGINRIPYTIVVDSHGRVTYAGGGIARSDVVRRTVLSALEGSQNTGKIYLTFDDFPAEALNDELLDVLRKEKVRVTFFSVCSGLGHCGGVDRRAVDEGHSLEIHSWDHDAKNPQLDRCAEKIRSVSGRKPTLYRPPGRAECFMIGGHRVDMQVVNPYDYTRPGKEEIVRRVLLAAKPGSVILLHAGVTETVDALPEIIRSLRGRKLEFAVLR